MDVCSADDEDLVSQEAAGSSEADSEPTQDFESFSVVESLGQHHFQPRHSGTAPTKNFVKAVEKDWKLLKSSLPEGVYVRACEDRMDLLRAAIVGPTKTPYEDALFIFDIYLAPDYPQTAPQVREYLCLLYAALCCDCGLSEKM